MYTPDQVRAAEQPLLARLGEKLMLSAAFAVAVECARLLDHHPYGKRVLVLAGSGGNGGDALYAAEELERRGAHITVWQTSTGLHHAYRRPEEPTAAAAARADLIIDGVVGIGASGGLRGEAAQAASIIAEHATCPVVAVDIPSGVDPMTGVPGDSYIRATSTVTFGGLKPVHVLGWEYCGDVVLRGLGIDEELASMDPWGYSVDRVENWPRPGADSNKYTDGVVGIYAGSVAYPGAAVLCVEGAVRATSPMVRYLWPCVTKVIRAVPEVVAGEGRVQALVIGPGCSEDDTQLAEQLRSNLPLVIDATSLTRVAESEELRELVRRRTAFTVLTPHTGEFARFGVATPEELARELDVCVLLKGRVTQVVSEGERYLIEAGSSWAATAGSGDVLSGVIGAAVAYEPSAVMVAMAARVHADAAALCNGPVPAHLIAEALTLVVSQAVAR